MLAGYVRDLAWDEKLYKKEVWLTMVALWVLREKFEEAEEEWAMIAKKARAWLQKQGVEQALKQCT